MADFEVDIPKIVPMETLRDHYRLAARMADIIQPALLIEAGRLPQPSTAMR